MYRQAGKTLSTPPTNRLLTPYRLSATLQIVGRERPNLPIKRYI